MAIADVWDQQVLTKLVVKNIEKTVAGGDGVAGEDRAFFGAKIAPLVTEPAQVARIRVRDVKPYGKGQFKAPDATPPLYKPTGKMHEFVIEMALLEEMERFTPREWMELNSTDERVQKAAKLTLLERLSALQLRNDRLTEWMRWEAFKGELVIEYPDGEEITVDYGLPGSHQVSAATAWTDLTNSDPIEDLFAWSQVGADDAGEYYSIVHLNSQTYRLVIRNEKIKAMLSALGRTVLLPTRDDLAQLMRDGTSNWEIIDAGYLEEGATNYSLTKFLPDNMVMLTTRYNLGGVPIADVADGQVLTGGGTGVAPDIKQGMQSELITNPFSKNVFRRQASARIPRIYTPEAFLIADVG